jgi:L-lactate utilization protein LutB
MFKKNQEVTVINLWSSGSKDAKIGNGRVTVSVDHAVVHSCGKVQMVLNSETESYKGKFFKPQVEQYGIERVLPRMSTEDALRLADALAEDYRQQEIARYNRILEGAAEHGEGYVRSITASRDHYVANAPNPSALLSDLKAQLIQELR